MKHFSYILFLLLLPTLLIVPQRTMAAESSNIFDPIATVLENTGLGSHDEGAINQSTAGIIASLVFIVLSLLGVIFFCLTLYGGFLWMTAGGNSDQVEKAQNIFKRSVIGLLIVFSSAIITRFVIVALTNATLS